MNNYNFFNCHINGQVSPVKRSPSILEVREYVAEQIEADCFSGTDKLIAKEICLIIAEVICLPYGFKVRISGGDMYAYTVADVYRMLTHEHIELIISNFKKVNYQIHNKKTYMRTALYNSVFELEAHYENLFNAGEDKG